MDIRHLQQFIALAEEGQFTAAARKVHVVQSGLSVTIKELEQELGAQLVNRTTRKVSLTPAGQLFLKYARSSLAMLNDGIQAVRSQDGVVQGRLRLGILHSLEPYLDLPVLLETFRGKYPKVEFAVRSLLTEVIPEQVRSGYVDLSFHAAIGESKWTGLKVIPFTEDTLVAVCSKKNHLAARRNVSLDVLAQAKFVDLTRERALRKLTDRIFSERNLERNTVYEVSDVQTMLQFVAEDLGVVIIPSALARSWPRPKQLHILPITRTRGPLPKWSIVIVTREERRHFPGKTIVDLFLETLEQLNYPLRAFGYVAQRQKS